MAKAGGTPLTGGGADDKEGPDRMPLALLQPFVHACMTHARYKELTSRCDTLNAHLPK